MRKFKRRNGYQHNTKEGGGLDTEGKGIKLEELSPGTRPQLQPDGRPELVGVKNIAECSVLIFK